MKKFICLILIICFPAAVAAHEKELLSYFKEVNPDIVKVDIIEYTSSGYRTDGLLIVRGTSSSDISNGKWDNELFGVFYVDSKLNLKKALDFIPTKRWYDYCVETHNKTSREFVVSFFGCTYQDQKAEYVYNLD